MEEIKMKLLKRKIDKYLVEWKANTNRLPLIVKGARQVGKTESIRFFANNNYENFVEINFALQKQYCSIFDDGFDVDTILKNISFLNPNITFVPYKTLIFFDELQDCVNCATSLKPFKLDERYDVICSGSMMGIIYNEIESNSVGYKEDYNMYSLDFEEYLWSKGYSEDQLEDLYTHMLHLKPLSKIQFDVLSDSFKEYLVLGGMPAVVNSFIINKNFGGTLKIQKQILADYEEDITKYATGLNKGKILSVYKRIAVFLGQENKRFQVTKISKNSRNREYIGVVKWLNSSGIIHVCHLIDNLSLPLRGNYNPNHYKIYFHDVGLLIGSLDEEAQQDLRENKNFNTYKGAIFENVIANMLVKQGYTLLYYRNNKNNLEVDFIVRDASSLIPVEVKAKDGSALSLNKLINNKNLKEIKFGIKLSNQNIGFNDKFYNFPLFLTFLLKRFLREKESAQ
jgi:predicted AAA+ superfamily ATPase